MLKRGRVVCPGSVMRSSFSWTGVVPWTPNAYVTDYVDSFLFFAYFLLMIFVISFLFSLHCKEIIFNFIKQLIIFSFASNQRVCACVTCRSHYYLFYQSDHLLTLLK